MKEILKTNFKKLLITITIMGLLCTNTLMVSAATSPEAPAPDNPVLLATYDMKTGGTQIFKTRDGDNISYLKISEISSKSRVTNGTYQIEHVRTASWRAGYFITVSNNNVTSAYGQYCYPLIGTITSSYLSIDSSVQVTYSFVHNIYSTYTRTGLYSVISGDNINVYGF